MSLKEVIVPMIDLARPTAMDYHAEKDHLYLADSEKLRIQRHHIRNGTKETFLDSRLANQTSLSYKIGAVHKRRRQLRGGRGQKLVKIAYE